MTDKQLCLVRLRDICSVFNPDIQSTEYKCHCFRDDAGSKDYETRLQYTCLVGLIESNSFKE